MAARLRAALAEPIRLEGMSFVIEVSVGIAMFPDDATADELLMQRADVAMYLAKERRSGVERYVPELDRNSPARLALLGELRRGLDRGELELHYQPKVYLADQRAAGIEALVRWRHPVRGMLTPDEFIPVVRAVVPDARAHGLRHRDGAGPGSGVAPVRPRRAGLAERLRPGPARYRPRRHGQPGSQPAPAAARRLS